MSASDGGLAASLEEKLRKRGSGKYVLRLFVAGTTPRSQKAIANITGLCQTYLEGRYELKVIDIYQSPIFAREGRIIAAPTLIKELPEPLKRVIGDMSDTERLIVGLDLVSKKKAANGRDADGAGTDASGTR